MTTTTTFGLALALSGIVACSPLSADTLILTGLTGGQTDTISIDLNPLDGGLQGLPGATVGWGFTVNWTSTSGDWVSFTGSSLGSESNPELLDQYYDYIGLQGGPVDFGLSPNPSPGTWAEAFGGSTLGVGAYLIAADAVLGANDIGKITFNFDVYDGDPLGGTDLGSFSYVGRSTNFVVSVNAPPGVPEPSTKDLLALGAGLLALIHFRSRQSSTR